MIGHLGPFLRSVQEDVIVQRPRAQGMDGYTYPVGREPIKAIILDSRSSARLTELVETGYSYACNLTPPQPDIKVDDQIVRRSGTATEQTLVVKNMQTVLKVQRLWADDLNRVE